MVCAGQYIIVEDKVRPEFVVSSMSRQMAVSGHQDAGCWKLDDAVVCLPSRISFRDVVNAIYKQ